MIVRTLKMADSASLFSTCVSRAIVKADDNVGHVVFDTAFPSGTSDRIVPRHGADFMSQAHYCLEGEGLAEIEGQACILKAGSLVATSMTRPISFSTRDGMRLCSVLNADLAPDRIIHRHLDEIIGTERDVFWGNGRSRRLLIKSDGLGFALCVTVGNPNTDSPLQYRNHYESCYYVSGSGEYVWDDGSHPIDTGDALSTVFIMNRNDAHRMVVHDTSICLSIFTPPIEGHETHNLTGEEASSY